MQSPQPVSHDIMDDGPDNFDRLAECLADAGLDFAQARFAARAAIRWHEERVCRDAELHCRQVVALMRFTMRYEELHASQQNRINREVAAVINTYRARLTDLSFLFLSYDQRSALQPERMPRQIGGVQ